MNTQRDRLINLQLTILQLPAQVFEAMQNCAIVAKVLTHSVKLSLAHHDMLTQSVTMCSICGC